MARTNPWPKLRAKQHQARESRNTMMRNVRRIKAKQRVKEATKKEMPPKKKRWQVPNPLRYFGKVQTAVHRFARTLYLRAIIRFRNYGLTNKYTFTEYGQTPVCPVCEMLVTPDQSQYILPMLFIHTSCWITTVHWRRHHRAKALRRAGVILLIGLGVILCAVTMI